MDKYLDNPIYLDYYTALIVCICMYVHMNVHMYVSVNVRMYVCT